MSFWNSTGQKDGDWESQGTEGYFRFAVKSSLKKIQTAIFYEQEN